MSNNENNNSDDKVVGLNGKPIGIIPEGATVEDPNVINGVSIKTYNIQYNNGSEEVIKGWLYMYPLFFSIGDNKGDPILIGPLENLKRIAVINE